MKYVVMVERILVALLFTMTGLNAFLNFMPKPPDDAFPKLALGFMQAIMNSGYIYLIGITQLAIAVSFLTNRFVPLAIVILAPLLVNIIAVHAFLMPEGIAMGLIVAAIEGHLIWVYRESFRPLFVAKNNPFSKP